MKMDEAITSADTNWYLHHTTNWNPCFDARTITGELFNFREPVGFLAQCYRNMVIIAKTHNQLHRDKCVRTYLREAAALPNWYGNSPANWIMDLPKWNAPEIKKQ